MVFLLSLASLAVLLFAVLGVEAAPAPQATFGVPIPEPPRVLIPSITLPNLLEFPLPLPPTVSCISPLRRKAWHKFSDTEKRAFIKAELCLMNERPSKTGSPSAKSRYEDLVLVHQMQAAYVHLDGWFLPFHRYFLWAHERILRDECGYTGAHPYWDETLDAEEFGKSEVFRQDDTGFGGNGDPHNNNCIKDGPFANQVLHLGPGYVNTDHCISRSFNLLRLPLASKTQVDICLMMRTYETMWPCLESLPHVAGHGAVGGVMRDPIASPGDPLFFMHHAFIDLIWAKWQKKNPIRRHREIAGHTTPDSNEPEGGFVKASVKDEMDMYGIVPPKLISQIMNIRGELCYEYV